MGFLVVTVLMVTVVVATAAVAQASAVACRFSAEREPPPCYAVLGESVSLHLTDDTTEEITLRKNKTRVLHLKPGHDCRTLPEEWKNRSVCNNGTLRIYSSTERDSGEYLLETHNRNGTFLRCVKLKLVIQAPVSAPVLSHVCLSSGDTQVTCSSQGGGLQFSWTLIGQALTDSVANQCGHSSSITVQAHLTGELTCQVQNDVSSSNTTVHLPVCHLLTCTVSVAVTAGSLLLLLGLCCGIHRLYKNLRSTNNTPAGDEGDGDDGVVYADVTVKNRQRPVKQTPAAAEYGQIKMAAKRPEVLD